MVCMGCELTAFLSFVVFLSWGFPQERLQGGVEQTMGWWVGAEHSEGVGHAWDSPHEHHPFESNIRWAALELNQRMDT